MRLNIGSGGKNLDGFESWDIKDGKQAFPLEVEDGSVDEIYASHVLEHMSHLDVCYVLQDWHRALKPGGRLRVAVPNFEWIAKEYLAGTPINVQGYVMGGHLNEYDKHGTVFDRDALEDGLVKAGFVRVAEFKSVADDCTTLDVSLNLQAWKPSRDEVMPNEVAVILSAPRFGPTMHFTSTCAALSRTGVSFYYGAGAYWHQVIETLMRDRVTDGFKYIVTLDYDTVYESQDLVELVRLASASERFDAVAALQMKRGCESALMTWRNKAGELATELPIAELDRAYMPVDTAHFGLTVFKAEALAEMPKPWFMAVPDPKTATWTDGKVDADIGFWRRFKEHGKRVAIAPNIRVGHLMEVISWPSQELKPIYQTPQQYMDHRGMPPEVWSD